MITAGAVLMISKPQSKNDFRINMDNDLELLLACSRAQMDKKCAERVKDLLNGNVDWDSIFKTARNHGLAPILYRNLMRTSPEDVPQNILSDLRANYLANASRSLFLTMELLRILEKFEVHGLQAIPFKGPALAKQVYGDIVLRQYGDLDIMVRKEDVLSAKDLLLKDGYTPEVELTPLQEESLLRSQCEYVFYRKKPRTLVEVHWRFDPAMYIIDFDAHGIWARLRSLELEGRRVMSISPEDMLLALCSHGARHAWNQMRLVCDLAGLIQVEVALDWEQVMRNAASLGAERILHLGLLLAHVLMEAELPEDVITRAKADNAARSLASDVLAGFFLEPEMRGGTFQRYTFWSKVRERRRDRYRYLLGLAVEPSGPEWELVSLPRPLTPFYHIIRPIRLLYNYGRRRGGF